MDEVLANTLKAQLKSAKGPSEISHAMTSAMIALVDCQQKTSGRVKWLLKAFWALGILVVIAILCGREVAEKLVLFGRG